MRAIDPSTGEVLREYPDHDDATVEAKLQDAARAARAWARKPPAERAGPLRRVAQLLREQAAPLADLMAREMGKPVKQGRSEAEKCAWACDFYAEHGERFLAPEPVATEFSKSYVAFEPLGVVLAVMPWNFPLWQAFRAAAPALMAGNGMVLKHASNVPGCSLAIERLWREAGLPEGVFASLLVGSAKVEGIIGHPLVAAATLTGSTGAGRSVGEAAGRHLKKSVLELGGSDAYLVLEDADVAHAAKVCATSRLINSGQSCIAAKRFLVVEGVRAEFERLFVDEMARATVGDPRKEDTQVGPLARVDLRDEVHEQVRRSVAAGARVLLGGEVPRERGAWYPPTVLTDVRKGMAAADEEVFGPVAAVIPVRDEAEAIAVANDSQFGLGAAVFTRDLARGERIARHELQAGCCIVNDFVRSDPRLPFGGVKESGYGRELGVFGIREFVNIKDVCVR
jgi:succinate-semialdehyde dehydrogenase/glutarate-semialdehyde dehydrogenase